MANLKNAPLIYTLGVVQFPRIPEFDRYPEAFFKLICNIYPLDEKITSVVHNANITPDGIQVERREIVSWQYLNAASDWGFILSENTICLHTSSYKDFEDFMERFLGGITALTNVYNLSYFSSIGFRYVNMIVSEKGKNLQNYIKTWILPVEPPNIHVMNMLESIHITRYKTEYGEMRLQAIKNPPYTIPPELNSQFMVKNGWIKERPPQETEFALIDIDHFYRPEPLENFDTHIISNKLHDLRGGSRNVFDSIGTEEAMSMWRNEK